MKEILLLDCTVRDGGYKNDWKFGHNTMMNIIRHLVSANVDFIELGFLDKRRPFDINRSIFPDTDSANKIFGGIEKKSSLFLGMIDYGTCPASNIQPASESVFDGIRVIFKKHLMDEAMDFCAEIKALGYKVFAQLVSITSYSDEELLRLVELVNKVEPFAVSMVDTYGLLLPPELQHYYDILDKNVKPSVAIGFHAHNNFQMAYGNCRSFLNAENRCPERTVLVDGTLYGMGKSAGNAPIEMLAMTLNRDFGKNYSTDHMLEAIRANILDCYKTSPWGYNWYFYISALNRCHPNYLSAFLEKEDLTFTDLNTLLEKPEGDKKLLYDENLVNDIYSDYKKRKDDSGEISRFSKKLSDRPVLLIGPGKNIQLQSDIVRQYIEENSPVVISINFIPGNFNVDYVFITNTRRYVKLAESLCEIKNKNTHIIATSNVAYADKPFDFIFNHKPLLEEETDIKDNSCLMLLRLLIKSGIKKAVCAGFDGYSSVEDNYFNSQMEYSFVKSKADYLNRHVREELKALSNEISLEFITYSLYTATEDINSAAF